MGKTNIEWTERSLNPLRARLRSLDADLQPVVNVGHYCEKVSPGCKNCYSSATQCRFGMPAFPEQRRADVEHWLDTSKLVEVLKRRKPTKYFWCSMTDMFGEWVPIESIALCFATMAATPWHTHQVLTKRPERMRQVVTELYRDDLALLIEAAETLAAKLSACHIGEDEWRAPLANVWLGTSSEDQKRADERIPALLATPAAVRFLSAEPLLGPLELGQWLMGSTTLHVSLSVSGALRNKSFDGLYNHVTGQSLTRAAAKLALEGLRDKGVESLGDKNCDNHDDQRGCLGHRKATLDWVIVGGESGAGARPFHVDWVRDIVKQCAAAKVACFVKQLGGRPLVEPCRQHHWDWGGEIGREARFEATDPLHESSAPWLVVLDDRKGGDMSEWPAALRVREFPKETTTK